VRLSLLAIPFIIFFDQVTKARFASSCNTGVAFGLFGDAGVLNIVAPVFVIGVCLYFLIRELVSRKLEIKSNDKIVSLALSLIIGGGLANLVDRLMMGCVRDFIDLGFWPSFNLADSAVTAGVALIIFSILFGEHERA